MVALVERGAPRDFSDIYAICVKGVTTPGECWRLWRRRQEMGGSDRDHARARLAITTHLARIVQHRPLDRIAEPEARRQAAATRRWYEDVFLGELE